MELTTRYQEEIRVLKMKNEPKTPLEGSRKPSTNKSDNAGLNILTTTDGSAAEQSVTESSGYLSNKDTKLKSSSKGSMVSQTPHSQTKANLNKAEERKSYGVLGNKSDIAPKVK